MTSKQEPLTSTDIDEWIPGDYALCGCCIIHVKVATRGRNKGEKTLVASARECKEHKSARIRSETFLVKDYGRKPRFRREASP